MSRLITKKQVAQICGCHPQTIARHAGNGFPAPIRLGGRGHPRWDVEEVEAWLAIQKAINRSEVGGLS